MILEKIFLISGIIAFCLYIISEISNAILSFIIGWKRGRNND